MCAVGFSALSVGRRRVRPSERGGATGRNRARRVAEDPASGLRARATCAGPNDAHEPPGSGGTGSYNEHIRSAHPPVPAPSERHHPRQHQADARSHPGQAPEEVLLELEAGVQTSIDPFQGRAPMVAALPCGATVGGGGEDAPVVPAENDAHHAPVSPLGHSPIRSHTVRPSHVKPYAAAGHGELGHADERRAGGLGPDETASARRGLPPLRHAFAAKRLGGQPSSAASFAASG